jgi:hypothetical protein
MRLQCTKTNTTTTTHSTSLPIEDQHRLQTRLEYCQTHLWEINHDLYEFEMIKDETYLF